MSNEELAGKMVARVEYMILQFLPKPTCASKHEAWQSKVREVKGIVADRLVPANKGINILV